MRTKDERDADDPRHNDWQRSILARMRDNTSQQLDSLMQDMDDWDSEDWEYMVRRNDN